MWMVTFKQVLPIHCQTPPSKHPGCEFEKIRFQSHGVMQAFVLKRLCGSRAPGWSGRNPQGPCVLWARTLEPPPPERLPTELRWPVGPAAAQTLNMLTKNVRLDHLHNFPATCQNHCRPQPGLLCGVSHWYFSSERCVGFSEDFYM